MFEKINRARDVLYSLARFCSLTPLQLERLFARQAIYPDKGQWLRYLERFLLALSGILVASGVVFFFAYNWADLHKFAKLGIVQALVVLLIGGVLISRFESRVKELLLILGAVMLGVLFAVFGQIYQTGANAYDFFQGWAMGVLLWAIAGRSSYLWLLFLILVNLTLHFYAEQVAGSNWPEYLMPLLIFLINAGAVIIWEILAVSNKWSPAGRWFPTLVGLCAIIFSTIGMCIVVFDQFREGGWIMLLVTTVLYGLGFWYGQWQHRMFYPAALGLSLIVIGTTFLVRLIDDSQMEALLLFSSLFVIGTTTALVQYLRHLSKHWHGIN